MTTVAIVGLGYVGLPLAVAFGRRFRTIGYDLAETKVASYRAGVDPNRQLSGDELRTAAGLEYTADPKQLGEADHIIVAVPTPSTTHINPISGRCAAPAKPSANTCGAAPWSFLSRLFIRAPRKKSACPYSSNFPACNGNAISTSATRPSASIPAIAAHTLDHYR